MNVDLEMINETDEDLQEYESLFLDIATYTFNYLKIEGEIECSVSFVDNQRIHEINRDYRHIDRPTDVITFALEDVDFPYVEGMPRELGDIFISVDKAKQQAQEYQHSLKREMCFLFVHGLLHLLGYDHMNEEDEKVMFQKQDEILNYFSITRKEVSM